MYNLIRVVVMIATLPFLVAGYVAGCAWQHIKVGWLFATSPWD